MKYASISWTRTAPATIASRKDGRPGFFAWLLESLHYSRRLQAERFLRQHRDLIDTAQRSILREFNSREEAERCWRDLGSGRRPDSSDLGSQDSGLGPNGGERRR